MSKNFEKVKMYYQQNLWTLEMVRNAVGRWVTSEEYELITGHKYEE